MTRHQPHLLVSLNEGEDSVPLGRQVRHHLEKVLRATEGSATYTDGRGLFGRGRFTEGFLVRGEEHQVGPPTSLTVAVAPPHSSDRTRFLVEKLAEIGVAQLLWLETAYGQGRVPRSEKATAWARSALEQSRGAWLMGIGGPVALGQIAAMGTPVFADPAGEPPDAVAGVADPVLCVGPEGGFAPDEVPDDALRLALGPTVLRVETAAIVAVSLLR